MKLRHRKDKRLVQGQTLLVVGLRFEPRSSRLTSKVSYDALSPLIPAASPCTYSNLTSEPS